MVLSLMPERQAKLLVLRQEEGLKYAELAAILDVAPSSPAISRPIQCRGWR